MSRARQFLSGTTYSVARRCTLRMFLLKPSKRVNQLFLYCLAYAAQKYGILVHEFIAMSNHYHIEVTDPHGKLPLFMQCLDSLLARSLNAHYGRCEHFWAPDTYDYFTIEDAQTAVDKAVYILANPVAAGLVKRSRLWPGNSSVGYRYGEPITVERPDEFFRENGPMPQELTFTLTKPPALAHLGDDKARSLVLEQLDAKEMRIRRKMKVLGQRFAGRHAVMRTRPFDSPDTPVRLRKLNPRVACRDPGRRVAALNRLKAFEQEYRECYLRWRAGDRGVVFPEGTYQLRVQHGVTCRAPP